MRSRRLGSGTRRQLGSGTRRQLGSGARPRIAVGALLIATVLLLVGPGLTAASTLAANASPATTATSDTSLADLEDEVMCPVCGTLLGLADAPQAQRQKAMITQMVNQGASKQEIKEAMVAEFGPEVLALPEDSGFGLAAYIVPIIGFLVAVTGLSVAVVRWRRQADDATEADQLHDKPDASGDESLDRDIARYEL